MQNPIRSLLKIPVPWVFVITYLIGAGLQLLFPFYTFSSKITTIIEITGAVIFIIGAAIAAWSLIIFHSQHTTTTPGEKSARLVTWGPYKYSRNPMYVSLTIAYLGEAGILIQFWPIAVLPLVLIYVNRIIIPLEESRLKEAFGSEYGKYSFKVPRWF